MNKTRIFDPDALEVLVTLADTRSFTETARLLSRSQSTVSATVQRLEEAVGCRLVSRTTRSVVLTTEGEEMVRYARRVHELSDEARRRFSEPHCTETVNLGVFTNFDGPSLSAALRAFGALYPSVQVRVEMNRSDILLSRFRDGALDIVLATRQPGHGFGTPLWQDELVWVGNRDLPRTRYEPIPLAVRVKPSMMRRLGIEALNVARRHHVVTFESNSFASVATAVEAGLGIGVFTRAIRPLHLPVLDGGILPQLGWIDFVLLKSADARDTVRTLYTIISDASPGLFETAAPSMFGCAAPPALPRAG